MAHGFSGVLPIPPFEMTALKAAGDLRSTAKDLLVFLAANRGWQATRLQPAMFEAQRSRSSTPTPGLGIALGWHLFSLNAGTAVWHDGATIGHRAFVGFCERQDAAVARTRLRRGGHRFPFAGCSVPLETVRRRRRFPS
jgi:hypothetical protein